MTSPKGPLGRKAIHASRSGRGPHHHGGRHKGLHRFHSAAVHQVKELCDDLLDDGLALGAYQAIKDADRRIPRDIAVVGVGDHEHADFFDPPLTCVGPSNETIVEQIVTQLFDLMNRRRVKPVETFVPPSVVMRASA